MIYLFVSIFCGYCAYSSFKDGSTTFGWLNLIMSAWNFASFMIGIGL